MFCVNIRTINNNPTDILQKTIHLTEQTFRKGQMDECSSLFPVRRLSVYREVSTREEEFPLSDKEGAGMGTRRSSYQNTSRTKYTYTTQENSKVPQ